MITREQKQIALNAIINWKDRPEGVNVQFYKSLLKSLFADVLREKRIQKERLAREERERAAEAIYEADIKRVGYFCMIWESTDCDCCVSTWVTKYETIKQFRESEESIGDWAEGPVSYEYCTPEEREAFKPSTRDLVMESLENGGDGFHLYK